MGYRRRLQRLQAAMQRNHLDGLIFGTGANFQYFTGLPIKWQRDHQPLEPDMLLVLSHGQEPYVLMSIEHGELLSAPIETKVYRSHDELISTLRGSLRGKRIGTSRAAEQYIQRLINGVNTELETVLAEHLGEELRLYKEADEVTRLRKVALLTDQVMHRVVGDIRPGITQLELQGLIAAYGKSLGATDVSFPPAALFVKSGSEPTHDPFVYPKEKGLVAGTSIAFDFGFVLDGYCSDFGRSFYCGPAPAHIAGAYHALQEAQCELISQMTPGKVKVSEMFGKLEAVLDRLGYGDYLRARLPDGTLGHQIGVDLHENPWIRPDCDIILQPGMVMAIEPKLWLTGEYYLRVEDMVLITDTGAESLTTFNRELFELPL